MKYALTKFTLRGKMYFGNKKEAILFDSKEEAIAEAILSGLKLGDLMIETRQENGDIATDILESVEDYIL